ncbi:protein ELYS isoform X2 [Leptopilina heterotoma]|uniref:protein ELYS isoform X2 n=1 Tax=Leptopilina heterotoma TaxID=63436 RepID=UPI001CA8611A|nr:protein ELYS isoform X2 [Leptopilina heterotoma]
MKELEDTNCENRRIVELQSSIWDRLGAASEDEQSPGDGQNDAFVSMKPLGGFLDGANHAWLSRGNRLIVINARTGESVSSWNFRYRITAVSPFPTQAGQLPLLLIGLDNDAHKLKDSIGMLCVFNCTTSRILRVIRVPCGVEQICVICGGTEWEELCDQKVATIFGSNSGIACVALRNFDYLIIDLQRSLWDTVSPYLVTDELSPYEIELPNTKGSSSSSRRSCNKEKHTACSLINSRIDKYLGFNRETFELMNLPEEKLTTSLINSKKIGCLIAGCLGRVILWQSDGTVGWISPQFDENMSVSHLALIEPADDPRPFYYLWITCEDDSGIAAPVLRMYAMLFEKKTSDNEISFKLESDPSLKFEIELDEGDKISCLLPVERENTIDRGEESLLLIGTNSRMLLFDLNQWYREQMPLTASECSNQNSILASYRTGSEVAMNSMRDLIVSTIYVPASIKEFVNSGPNALEELFFPNSLSFEWIELSAGRISFWLTRGVQADLLRKIVTTGPVSLIQPIEIFHRCINAGLVPFNTEFSFNSDHNGQREMLLSLCLEQGWTNFLVKCAKEWSDGSASYLFPAFLRWSVQRGTSIKIYADQLSVALFDQSGTNIGESEAKVLRFCCQQLESLSIVVNKLNGDSVDFIMQQRALKRVANYFQILVWFYDVGLLPETLENDESDSRIPYAYQSIMGLYREKREKLSAKRNNREEENLFIDNLINRECSSLRSQWEREGAEVGSVGSYPPPSLQSLLRSYLSDCHQDELVDLEHKHQITYYFLLDLAMTLNDSSTRKNQLVKYPAAFKLSPSLIKLVQAFWLLDHEDYQGFLDIIIGQSILESDIKDWHHQLVIKNLMHDNQHKLALIYLRVRKPPLMTLEEQETVISLSVEYGLVQSAFHCRPSSHYSQLLMRFFRACKNYGKLSEILHLALDKEEEDAFVRFLEEDKSEETKLLYYLQRSRFPEASTISSSSRFGIHLQKPVSLNMFQAYNGTLPEITRRFTSNQLKKNDQMDLDVRYPRPMSHARSYNKLHEIYDTVVRKAKETFNRSERTQIPFVSAPCMSLKSHPTSTEVNCVQFMQKKKYPVKRTIHQVQAGETLESSETKRIKLSDQSQRSLQDQKRKKSLGKINDKSILGIENLFSTPLVKCKGKFTNPVSTPLETPHSILKIRQLIRHSGSPSLNISPDLTLTEPISEKKPRQIRFSVSQIHDESFQSELSSSKLRDDSKEVIDEEPSEVSEEHFFSPNVSARSEESSILSDTSISFAGPRPRPSLQRRSVNLSMNDSRRNSSKTASPSRSLISTKDVSVSPTNSDFNVSTRSSRTRNPLLSSIYSSSVLSDLSYDESFKAQEQNNSRDEKTSRISKSMSFTCVVKTVVEKMEIVDEKESEELNDTVVEEVSNEDIDDQLGLEFDLSRKISQVIDKTIEIDSDDSSVVSEKSPRETEFNGEIHAEKLIIEESGKIDGIHEDTNRNILPEGAPHSMTELDGESSDELEMLPLKDEEDEVFESLSNSINTDVHSPRNVEERMDFSKDITDDDDEEDDEEDDKEDDKDSTEDDEENEKEDVEEYNKDDNKEDTEDDKEDNENKENDDKDDENEQSIVILDEKLSDEEKIVDSLEKTRNNTSISENLSNQEVVEEKVVSLPKRRVSLRNTPIRETRATRASSLAKENVIVENSSIHSTEVQIRETRSQKTKNTSQIEKTQSPPQVKEDKSKRIKKDSPVAKISKIKESEEKIKLVEKDTTVESVSTPRRSRRASSVSKIQVEKLPDEVERRVVRSKTPPRDGKTEDESEKRSRAKRGSSLVKEILSSTVELGTKRGGRKISSESEVSVQEVTPKRGRPKKIQETEVEEKKEEETSRTLRRNTRRAASVQRELSTLESTVPVDSKIEETIVEPVEIDTTETKRNTRSRRANSVSKEVPLPRLTRGTSLSKEIPIETQEPVRQTRRRGNSVPKEISLVPSTSKSKRSANVSKETEESSMQESEEIIIPVIKKRNRCPSVQSIPEEVEEILNIPTRSKSSRSRRAVSVDLPVEPKRYTRSSRLKETTIVEDVIQEESRVEEQMRSSPPPVVRQNTRRKRAASETIANEKEKEEVVVVAAAKTSVDKSRRGRKVSQKSDDVGDEFSFSPPEQTSPPKDKKGISQVHNFVFSPPHTRSKQTSQPRS